MNDMPDTGLRDDRAQGADTIMDGQQGVKLDPACKYAPEHLGRVLVLGSGVTGRACTSYLLDLLGTRVEDLVVAAGESSDEGLLWADDVRERGAKVLFDCEIINDHFDLCIASPGISQFSDFYQSALVMCAEVISEVEFAWRESAADSLWVAITGTNGKTTTSALCAHVLCTADMSAGAVGNIGDTCIEAVAAGQIDVYVAETSSYQLASTVRFTPDVAVVLNITPDHLNWHDGYENYVQAKWKILDNLALSPVAVAVFDATDDEVRAKVRQINKIPRDERGYDYVPIGTKQGLEFDMRQACGSDNAAFIDEQGNLRVAFEGRDVSLVNADDLKIRGSHNLSNALATAVTALVLDANPAAICNGLLSFESLAHRLEPIGEVGGVICYNDSKATNVDATLAALASFDTVQPIVLLGGRDKETDLDPLVAACREHVRAVVCFGEAKDRFVEAFGGVSSSGDDQDKACTPNGSLTVLQANHLADALDAALAIAHEGDVVLLSPACASFDEFSCFGERGDVFKKLVGERAALVQDDDEDPSRVVG